MAYIASYAPIDCIAPLLQAAAVGFATDVDRDNEFLFGGVIKSARMLSREWENNQNLTGLKALSRT